MIISKENRYIFIAVPKTGTTSIQKLLLEQDPTANNYYIEIDGTGYKFGEHDTALQIKRTLGEHYAKFRTFGFMRNPYSRVVSSYFFYKRGGKLSDKRNKKKVKREFKFLSAKILPFKIWTMVYPYKSNKEYFVDEHGELIVDFIGKFEDLGNEFQRITEHMDLHFISNNLPHANKSKHDDVHKYFLNKFFKKLINLKIGEDLNFYNKYTL